MEKKGNDETCALEDTSEAERGKKEKKRGNEEKDRETI